MLRWVLGLVILVTLACSSSTTNEGSGGSSSGGASSGGAAGSGGGGGSPSCDLGQCVLQLNGSECDASWTACNVGGECGNKVKEYVGCVCGGAGGCSPPTDNAAAIAVLNCVADSKQLSPLCFGFECVSPDAECSKTDVYKHCCAGTFCGVDSTCK